MGGGGAFGDIITTFLRFLISLLLYQRKLVDDGEEDKNLIRKSNQQTSVVYMSG